MKFQMKGSKCQEKNCFQQFGFLLVFLSIFSFYSANAQGSDYTIDVSKTQLEKPIVLTKLGGTAPNGDRIAVNNNYITQNGLPIIPITGEFHFTRYPEVYWDESIKKMKTGGVNTIATYVFWNIHEENEGKFDWSGNRDLRKFIELCKKNAINVIVRIGPFDHGEIRNGGIPDWILAKPLTIRTNDPLYLKYVSELYDQIGKQLKGLYFKDGGPIIGIQLENEYQHAASPWGLTYPGQPFDLTVAERDIASAHEGVSVASSKNAFAEAGNEHMRTLKALAIKAGMDVPIYTATGWGYAALIPNETLPVTAAYAYPTWTAKKELSPFYLFKDLHKQPDYSPVRYKPEDYPAFAAELGSGIMTTYERRPIVPAESVDALINRCLGSGANGIGYYMFHGGSTPVGQHYFFNDEAFGYPKISYDFQAPIGEYGQVRPSFNRLKLIHDFVNDFAAELAPMVTILPSNAATLKPNDLQPLRYATRTDGEHGFVFINNFQDDTITPDRKNIHFNIRTKSGMVSFPTRSELNVPSGESLILPFNLPIGSVKLEYATAQLMAKFGKDNRNYVFFAPTDNSPELCFEKNGLSVKALSNCSVAHTGDKLTVYCGKLSTPACFQLQKDGKVISILVISKDLALKSSINPIEGTAYMFFSDGLILPEENKLEVLSTGRNEYDISIFPRIKQSLKSDHGTVQEAFGEKLFSTFKIQLPEVNLSPTILETGTRKLQVKLPVVLPEGLNDIFMNIDYIGDTGMGFLNDELVTDEFYKGIPWEIGLKRFLGKSGEMDFYFRPLYKNAPFMVDLPGSVRSMFGQQRSMLKINKVSFTPEYKTLISFN